MRTSQGMRVLRGKLCMDEYRITVWDKQAKDPFYIVKHHDMETAQQVARNLQRHYVDDWGEHGKSMFEIHLHRMPKEADDE